MKKKTNMWIGAGILTLASGVATLYCLLEFRQSVVAVGLPTLIFLASAMWLFSCLAKLIPQPESKSVGEEQHQRMNLEGLQLQGEELLHTVNHLGKGLYVQSKHANDHLTESITQAKQAQEANEQLLSSLVDEYTKAAKMQIKYNQQETGKLILALGDACNTLHSDLEQCNNLLHNQPVAASPDLVNQRISDLSVELAKINASLQGLQLQMQQLQSMQAMMPSQPMMVAQPVAPVQPMATPELDETTAPATPELDETTAPATPELDETTAPATPELDETTAPATPIIEESTEDLLEDIDLLLNGPKEEASNNDESKILPFTEPVPEPTEGLQEELLAEPISVQEEAPAPVASLPLSDDPNKQLSPEEIAALFAALG